MCHISKSTGSFAYPYGAEELMRLPLAAFIAQTARIFLLVCEAYHSLNTHSYGRE